MITVTVSLPRFTVHNSVILSPFLQPPPFAFGIYLRNIDLIGDRGFTVLRKAQPKVRGRQVRVSRTDETNEEPDREFGTEAVH